jgi:hypothetical protein
MYAFQGGMNIRIPWLSFSSLTLSLTKIEPYCYTHTRVFTPWYGTGNGGIPMETAYVSNGENLGYYLPPNSAELLAKFETMPGPHTKLRVQYQLVIHGADYGSHAVDGSNLLSELDPENRDTNPVLKKFFLQDGAYQWQNVVKIGVEHTLAKYKLPIRLFGEIGVVHSFFSDIDGAANSGGKSSFSIVNTPEYPHSTRFIVNIGFVVYPDF